MLFIRNCSKKHTCSLTTGNNSNLQAMKAATCAHWEAGLLPLTVKVATPDNRQEITAGRSIHNHLKRHRPILIWSSTSTTTPISRARQSLLPPAHTASLISPHL